MNSCPRQTPNRARENPDSKDPRSKPRATCNLPNPVPPNKPKQTFVVSDPLRMNRATPSTHGSCIEARHPSRPAFVGPDISHPECSRCTRCFCVWAPSPCRIRQWQVARPSRHVPSPQSLRGERATRPAGRQSRPRSGRPRAPRPHEICGLARPEVAGSTTW